MPKKKFSEDYQPTNRRGRGKSEKTKFLEALQRRSMTEVDFYDKLIEKALDEDSSIAMTEVLKRISPIPKQVAPSIEFDLDTSAKPHEKASQILDAISSGQIPPDIGATLMQSIKVFVDIEEYTDLKARIEKLEELLNAGAK